MIRLCTSALTIGCGVILAAATALPALAEQPERWIAESRTARAITGDIEFTSTVMQFENGSKLDIKRERRIRDWTTMVGGQNTAELYRVTKPSVVTLESGNTLCDEPVTFIVIYYGDSPSMAAYRGAEPPTNTGYTDNLCGTFHYMLE